MEQWVAEIRLRARRCIGDLSAGLETVQGIPNAGKKSLLAAAGISTSEASRCEQLASVPAVRFEAYVAERKASGKPVLADDVARLLVKQ